MFRPRIFSLPIIGMEAMEAIQVMNDGSNNNGNVPVRRLSPVQMKPTYQRPRVSTVQTLSPQYNGRYSYQPTRRQNNRRASYTMNVNTNLKRRRQSLAPLPQAQVRKAQLVLPRLPRQTGTRRLYPRTNLGRQNGTRKLLRKRQR